ncbi:MAG: 16S rRNA (cytidine(1402)-2'-O)-methyltransferase [Peptostreptococcus sp.]|uniref:16S rRNA (cytidine(1402)-2'-O)-methyltransferase n=1 Tax=Peptostreptococcus sp. TaxID=1262 RepID=UPI002FC7472C
MSGKLYVCPTPIGNLEDITYRTLRIFNEVDMIAAEDTRHTIKLLNHFEISKPLTSYHEHNKNSKGYVLIEALKEGKNIALVSDAGMPGISDPGEDIVRECIENSIDVEILPGASAFVIALVGSGIDTRRFTFEGFLDREKKKKKKRIEEIKNEKNTLIIYESPHRLKETLKLLREGFGDRKISLCRELTKKHEEYIRTTIEGAITYYEQNDPRGEYILIIEGNKNVEESLDETDKLDDREYVKHLMDNGMSKKDAIKTVAKKRGLKRDVVYQQALDL